MINLDETLIALSRERPVFHSEADFQHALAWHIHERHPHARIRLEYRPLPNEPLYVDLWVRESDGASAIELKYATRQLTVDHDGERFTLANHAAQPIRRHDFVKDIARLERIVMALPEVTVYAVFLTNDSGYWTASRRAGTVDAAFHFHEGACLSGPLTWSERVGTGTSKKREAVHDLRGSYPIVWKDYSSVGAERKLSRFRFVTVCIDAAI